MKDDLSKAMLDVIRRMADGVRQLVCCEDGKRWRIDGDLSGWSCSQATVQALRRRNLIVDASLSGVSPAQTYVLAIEVDESAQSTDAPPELDPQKIQIEAYLISLERGDGDAIGHWFEAERRLDRANEKAHRCDGLLGSGQ